MSKSRSIDKPLIVTTDADLMQLCDRLRDAGCFAFDTEFIMEDAFEKSVCLIQVATPDLVALIDPIAGVDTAPFWELVADDAIEVVLHAGAEDLAICRQLIGKTPKNVFDIQIARGLISGDYPLSLSRLVMSARKVKLHKSQTLTDWRKRPLSDEQIVYAVEDVAHIPAIHASMKRKLDKLGRMHWAREEFTRFEEDDTYVPPKESRLMRLKGSKALDAKGQAIASELLDARDEIARKLNRPARAMLRDHLMIEIARHGWTKPEQIRSLRGINLRSSAIDELIAAVKRGIATNPKKRILAAPQHADDAPDEQMLEALVNAVLRDFCIHQNVAFSLLTNKQAMRQFVRCKMRGLPHTSPLASGWRMEACGALLDTVLLGRTAVSVAANKMPAGDSTNGEAGYRLCFRDVAPS